MALENAVIGLSEPILTSWTLTQAVILLIAIIYYSNIVTVGTTSNLFMHFN